MKDVRFVTRADDAGSSHSANLAIARVIRAGFIKNVSVMAPGAYVEEAAAFFAGNKKVCFGMHATLNAEWDRIKWGPVGSCKKDCGLLDERGMFLPDPKLFEQTRPDIEVILSEYDAQLDKLTKAGFPIRYVDSHMIPELWVPGLDEAVEGWAGKKGLLYHMYYYALPPGWERIAKDGSQLVPVLKEMPSGQYFYLAHPALYSEEMLLTGNGGISGEEVAKARDEEARMLSKRPMKWFMRYLGIRPVRYDTAIPGARRKPEELKQMLNG